MESVGDPREGPSTERAFEAKPVPPWTEQVTGRALAASLALGAALSGVMMNLVFTSGIIPSLNISAGLLGFFLLRAWTRLLDQLGVPRRPFTRQENAVVQTCVVACASMTYSGGFGSYLLAMDRRTAEKTSTADATGANVSEPTLGRTMAFFFLVSFVGLLAIVPMRKTMIIRHRLTFPSGTATAHLINSFHTPHGARQAKRQVSLVIRSCLGSLFWSVFQWFYSGGPNCGFTSFPTFGLNAFQRGFYINLNGTYIGVGMISPYLINISMLVSSIISWGIVWPYIQSKRGSWYDADLQESSLKGLNGYKVFGAIAMILGDGIFQLVVISMRTIHTMRHHQVAAETMRSFSDVDAMPRQVLSFDDRRRTQVFLREHIPNTFAIGGYVVLAALSAIAIPHIFGQVRFYHVAVAYVFAPLLAFCNAYGTGVAETNFSAQYNKLVILLFASWIGVQNGGVVGSLVICGVVASVVSTASDFMSDFKTGYLTLTSPRATLVSQVIGTALGCIVNPVVFNVLHYFYESNPKKIYQAPLAKLYRAIAVLGAGDLELPKHCLGISVAFFVLALAVCAIRELAAHKRWPAQQYIPSVTGMAVSFLLVPAVSIDMCVGSLILFAWNRTDREAAQVFAPVLAAGLICGDGLFSIPYALLARYNVAPPICVRFLGRKQNESLDEFLASRTASS
ncbi:probable metal-nicotianamine transporter YSL18 [Phragmites australis]|uniref:probable metal-nicotianamine transporter YSL18 n=1 Tax=Phragmites australis TaxID=29695 RepID=UPI002D76FC0B|nr:probable metal-nicotianamine transporter YSL18 [Phragmites australis]